MLHCGLNILMLAGTEAALVLSSGMAAISSTLMTLLKAGDHMLIQVGGLLTQSWQVRHDRAYA